jgi:mono/diheme cytochrome c family protein
MRAVVAAAGAAIALSGCASASYGPLGSDVAAAARGEALAQRACGRCHGLGLAESRFPGAPAFRDMHFDYNAISYQRRLAELHAGYAGMPPAELSLGELAEIGAYVRALQHPSAANAPRRND